MSKESTPGGAKHVAIEGFRLVTHSSCSHFTWRPCEQHEQHGWQGQEHNPGRESTSSTNGGKHWKHPLQILTSLAALRASNLKLIHYIRADIFLAAASSLEGKCDSCRDEHGHRDGDRPRASTSNHTSAEPNQGQIKIDAATGSEGSWYIALMVMNM
ncbi:hypothetical protein PSHT_07249 [Puccinia striiformis]|uniref:Uncharacterized protein n=1 Tax=Puccinia striiformis TaxID=27350 RepID=A0A2S4VZC8_9BASI|nr:hypothetical protein PSHT_07249 [Puccinia striiformis]